MNDAPLSIEVRYVDDEVTLGLVGELDISTVPTLRSCIESVDDGCRVITLDLDGLTFLDSTGIGLLMRTQGELAPDFRELHLANPSDQVRRVLEIAGVDQTLKILERPRSVTD